ncbi:DUF5753 domain-containing protein [Amycolatopsis sp. NPDC059027]|uniref:DUF5753 domain-containing protein n=1 Tax=Amycolatopsis sp. NPDC059027 TaxID=3346709 RepID=UPI00366AB125
MLAKQRLGRRLRRLRLHARMSLDEAAVLLDTPRSSLQRMETGVTYANVHFVRSAMDVCDCRDDELIDLARRAKQRGWWQDYGLKGLGYTALETEAAEARNWEVMYVPGLLQIESYMRALFRGGHPRSEESIRNDVTVRLRRQERLADMERPLRLTAIVDEAVLRRPVGGVDVMRAQLDYLREIVELPTVGLQVVPYDRGEHQGMRGAFTILRFEHDEDPDMLYMGKVVGSSQTENAEEVKEATLVFDRLRSVALSSEETIAFIGRL